jgi:hypothetical protein
MAFSNALLGATAGVVFIGDATTGFFLSSVDPPPGVINFDIVDFGVLLLLGLVAIPVLD